MIYSTGIFLAFFLALLALFKKGRSTADLILGIWLMIMGCHASFFYFTYTHDLLDYPHLLGLDVPLPFVHNPLFYCYVLALIKPKKLNTQLLLMHFLLPILIYLLLMPLFLASTSYKMDLINRGVVFVTWSRILITLMALSSAAYAYLIQKELKTYKTGLQQTFSTRDRQQLGLINIIFYTMIGAWLIVLLTGVRVYIFGILSFLVILIGYFGIKQVGVFTNRQYPEEDQALALVPQKDKKKYSNSGLNAIGIQVLQLQLLELMAREKPFLNPELTLTELASQLHTHPNYLSQVLNDELGANFYDYINALRVEEFKRLVTLPENQKYTLLALAYQSGFNSKAAFNRNFKKLTQESPSLFLKKHAIAMN
jgi:AraC-like DNA-binding protein